MSGDASLLPLSRSQHRLRLRRHQLLLRPLHLRQAQQNPEDQQGSRMDKKIKKITKIVDPMESI